MTVTGRKSHGAAVSAEPGGILRRVMRNLGYLVGGKTFSGLLGLGYMAFSVRALGVASFGQLMLIYAFVLTVATVVKFQTWQPILHFGTPLYQKPEKHTDFLRLILFAIFLDLISSLAGALVAVGGVWIIGPWIGLAAAAVPAASLFGLALLFIVTATADGMLRLFDRFDLLLVEDNIRAVVRFFGSLLFLVIGGTLNDLLAVWFLSIVTGSVACAYLAWRESKKHMSWAGSATLVREALASRGRSLTAPFPGIWKFVWSTNANASVGLVTSHVPTLIVGGMIGATDAGLFRIARQIAEALATPVKLMVPVFYPELARLVAVRDYPMMRTLNNRATLISCAGAAASFFALCLLGPWALLLIGGHQTDGAYIVMLFLSAAALIKIGTFTQEPTLISLGRPATALLIQIAAALIYLPLLVWFVHLTGINGAGLAAVTAAALTALIQYIAVSLWFRSAVPAGCSIS